MGTAPLLNSDSLIQEGLSLITDAFHRGLTVRLLGGAAVAIHCCHSGELRAHRPIGDLDIVTTRASSRALPSVLATRGYEPEKRFNALHGHRRMVFIGPLCKLDVFVDTFEMCHRIRLGDRLSLDAPTVSVSDLLLTKTQVVELNQKDVDDIQLLLATHEVAEGEGDHLNLQYLQSVVHSDWGLWRTSTKTLERVARVYPAAAPQATKLAEGMTRSPKALRFRLRGLVGERMRWYELPET